MSNDDDVGSIGRHEQSNKNFQALLLYLNDGSNRYNIPKQTSAQRLLHHTVHIPTYLVLLKGDLMSTPETCPTSHFHSVPTSCEEIPLHVTSAHIWMHTWPTHPVAAAVSALPHIQQQEQPLGLCCPPIVPVHSCKRVPNNAIFISWYAILGKSKFSQNILAPTSLSPLTFTDRTMWPVIWASMQFSVHGIPHYSTESLLLNQCTLWTS